MPKDRSDEKSGAATYVTAPFSSPGSGPNDIIYIPCTDQDRLCILPEQIPA